MATRFNSPAIQIAALMPHAPVLVPAAGGERAQEAATTVAAMRAAAHRLIDGKPQALAVVSPHAPRRSNAFGIYSGARLSGTLADFGAPSACVELPAARAVADEIAREAFLSGLRTWEITNPGLDHGAVVPLCFALDAGWDGPTVVVGLNEPGQAGAADFGRVIASAAAACGVNVALIASGDMSHRLTPFAPAGYDPRGAEFDRWLIETIRLGDYRALCDADAELEWHAGEDALDSVLLAAGATGFDSSGHEVLSYEGPFGVGYGVAILHERSAATDTTAAQTEEPIWSHH